MSDTFQDKVDKAAAFQKIWLESLSKSMQAAWTSFSAGDSPPPEMMRQMRSGIFEALSESWDKFMRSPEFLEVTRQWIEQAVSFRKMTNDLIAKARKEAQAPSTENVEDVILAVRHMEKRLLDRIDDLAAQVKSQTNGKEVTTLATAAQPRPARRRTGGKRKKPAARRSIQVNAKTGATK